MDLTAVVGPSGPQTPGQTPALVTKPAPAPLSRNLASVPVTAESALVTGNRVTLLRDGPPTLKAMFAAIRKAKHHVNIEYYLLEDVENEGQHLGDLLIAKRRQGVAVHVIYDSVGSSGTPPVFFDRLRQAGVKVVEFSPIQPLNTVNGLVLKELLPFTTSARNKSFNDRDHRKILIVDGTTAIVGGVNLSGLYQDSPAGRSGAGGTPTERWRDTDLIIEGPVVRDIQQIFLRQWESQEGPPLDARKLRLDARVGTRGNEVVRILASTPDDEVPQYYITILSAIRNAQQRVWLSAAYFVPTRQQMDFLVDAAKRGVDVRILLADKSDSTLAIAAAHSHYARLLEAGVRIYETHSQVLHTKTLVVDGAWSVIGSSNFDYRSVLFNDEIDAVVVGTETAREMEQMFADDIAGATEITTDEWPRRPYSIRLKEFFALAVERWL